MRVLPQHATQLKRSACQRSIGEMFAGKRAVTADTDLGLCRFFGLPDGWWLTRRVRAARC
ncbi:MAG: hypothetical protein IT508_03815 [Burkholderiaceae bacterium]|nr:hypothetical protein [Burkholderiaceae bacterium]